MQVLNVRQFRSVIPTLQSTLQREREIVLVSNGVPVARVSPIEPENELTGLIRSTVDLRARFAPTQPLGDSTALIRAERDLR